MKILSISNNSDRGGAAVVARSLNQHLTDIGVDVTTVVARKQSENPNVVQLEMTSLQGFFNNKFFITEGLFANTYIQITQMDAYKEADIIHLHNFHSGRFNVLDVLRLSKTRPTVWTLHDPWIIHHFGLTPEYNVFFSRETFISRFIKNKFIKEYPGALVAPSKWLTKKVRPFFEKTKIELINNGIDTHVFKTYPQSLARKELGLPLDKKIILFAAYGGEKNRGKGVSFLSKTKEAFSKELDVLFISLGDKTTYIDDPRKMVLYYNAVDLFLSPSLAESYGLTLLEARSCGIPVVAFDIGGTSEIIRHKENGYLARYKDTADLISGMRYFLDRKDRKNCANNSSIQSTENMTDQYINLYTKILTER